MLAAKLRAGGSCIIETGGNDDEGGLTLLPDVGKAWRGHQLRGWQFELEHAAIEADAVLVAVNRGVYATGSKVSSPHGRYCPADNTELQCRTTRGAAGPPLAVLRHMMKKKSRWGFPS